MKITTEEPPAAGDALACGPLWLSPREMCEARVRGRRVPLSLVRLRLLESLIRAGGRVVTRAELYREACGDALREGSRAIDVHIARIRRALGPLGRFILTVPGLGYRLDIVALSKHA